jgi:hypothetical protein
VSAKQIAFDQEAREAMRRGVSKLARAVKITLGPRGRNVIIQKSFGSPTVTKDGVTVAKEIELEDKYENMGARMVREVASKTNDVAGDGTTTATVLAEAIYNEGLRAVVSGINPMLMKRGIDKAVDDIVAKLKEMSIPVKEKRDLEVGRHHRRQQRRGDWLDHRRRDGEGGQGRGHHRRRGQDHRDDPRVCRGHAVRPRLPLALLRHRSADDGVRPRRPLHPHLREEDQQQQRPHPRAGEGAATGQADPDYLRGSRGRGTGYAGGQQAA